MLVVHTLLLLPYAHYTHTCHTYKTQFRPPTDPELPPAQACLINYERYRPLVEALRLGMGPARHLERCVPLPQICRGVDGKGEGG